VIEQWLLHIKQLVAEEVGRVSQIDEHDGVSAGVNDLSKVH